MLDNLLHPSVLFEDKRKWQYCSNNLKLQKLAKVLMSILEAPLISEASLFQTLISWGRVKKRESERKK